MCALHNKLHVHVSLNSGVPNFYLRILCYVYF